MSNLPVRATTDRRMSAIPSTTGRRSTVTASTQPATQRPPGMPRPSTASLRQSTASQRQSTAFGASSRGGLRQDPRPLTDRQFIQQAMRKLLAFLDDHGYECQFSLKTLPSLSSKEFESILTFLLHFIDPSFEFKKKLEEELPSLVKCLGYPFNMSKSALSAIGSPHTWPPLLGFLIWLVDLVKYYELGESMENDRSMDHRDRRDKFFLDQVIKIYALWLEGAESYPDLEREEQEFFAAECTGRDQRIDNLRNDKAQLEQSRSTLETQPSPLALAKEHLRSLEGSTNQFKMFLPSLTDHMKSIEVKLVELDKEDTLLTVEIEELKDKRRKLEPILERQAEDGIDAERVIKERDILEAALKRVHVERTQVEADLKMKEAEFAEKQQYLNSLVIEYNRGLESHDLYHPTFVDPVWPSRESLTISVKTPTSPTSVNDILDKDVEEITDKLRQLNDEVSRDMPELQDKLMKVQERVDELEEKMMISRHEVKTLEDEKEKLEREYESVKREIERSLTERTKVNSKLEQDREKMLKDHEVESQELDDRIEKLHVLINEAMNEDCEIQEKLRDLMKTDLQLVRTNQQSVIDVFLSVRAHAGDEAPALDLQPK